MDNEDVAELTPERLAEIRKRLEVATPTEGATAMRYDHGGGRLCQEGEGRNLDGRTLIIDAYHEGDREFYFHAYDDMRFLLDHIDAQADEIDRLRRIETAAKRVRATHRYDHSRAVGVCDCSLCQLNKALDTHKGDDGA